MLTKKIRSFLRRPLDWLHQDYNANLGINNTFLICKAINSVVYGSRMKRHRSAYLEEFESLLLENGPIGRFPSNFIRDGYCIDRSGALPYLRDLLKEGEALIQAQGGLSREQALAEKKPFFYEMALDDDLAAYPGTLNFLFSSEVLATVAHQMGCIPVFSRISPPGIRMMESNEAYNPNPPGTLVDSQFYHLDIHDRPLIYVIVLLRDTTEASGPWHFLPASTSERARRLLKNQERGRPYRVTDEEMYSVVDPNEMVSFTGKAGDTLFIESWRCYHYGSRNAVTPRYQAMFAFTTPCRGDLKEWLWRGQRPQAGPGDSRLRKMVLRCR